MFYKENSIYTKEMVGSLDSSVGVLSIVAERLYKKTEDVREHMIYETVKFLRKGKNSLRYGRSSVFR